MVSRPKLSICIPTFNRSGLLDHLLCALTRELRDIGSAVEVVISDNCSTDDTSSVVRRYREKLELIYHKNEINRGVSANILGVTDHARGDYAWILGDDDLPVEGSLSKVMEVINANPEILGIVTGYSYEKVEEKEKFLSPKQPIGYSNPIFKSHSKDGMLAHWEDSILLSDYAALHTSIVSCVFRLDSWQAMKAKTFPEMNNEALTSFENTFPYLIIWAKMFTGKPVYLLSSPQIYFFVGAQEWFAPKWNTILFSFGVKLPDLFRDCGADIHAVRHYELCIFRHSDELLQLILDPNDYAQKHFCLRRLLSRYGNDPKLLSCIAKSINRLPNKAERLRILTKLFIADLVTWPIPLRGLICYTKEFVRLVL